MTRLTAVIASTGGVRDPRSPDGRHLNRPGGNRTPGAAGRSPIRVGTLAGLTLLVAAGAAGAAPGPGAATIFDAVTVVASNDEQPVGEIAGTASVVDRAELDLRQAQSLPDLVRYEPGVTVVGEAGRFGAGGFRIRGLDGNRVAIEVDGAPLPDGFAVGSFSNAGRDLVDPELVERVEILRGPASALHGGDALAGVVLLVTREPSSFLRAGERSAVAARTGWDGRDRGARLGLLAAVERDEWSALLTASRREASELGSSGSTPPDPASSERDAVHLRLLRTGGRAIVELIADRDANGVATDVRHLRLGPGAFATTERLLADDATRRSRLALSLSTGNGRGPFAGGVARLRWSDFRTTQETTQWRVAADRAPHPTRRDRRFDYRTELRGGEWTARSAFSGLGEHRLVWGVESDETRIAELRDGTETDRTTGATTSVVLGESLPVRDFPLSTVRETGVYVADDWILPGDRWRLQPALRWDRYRSRPESDPVYREDYPGLPVVEGRHEAVTPKLGLTRRLGERSSAWLQIARGFRAPPFSDVNVGLRIAAFGYEAIPNPDLRPERSTGVELGWRHAGPAVSAQVAVYENRYRDLIESRVLLGRDPVTGITTFQSLNRDRARIRGVEGRVRVELGRLSPALDGWRLDGSLAASEGEDLRRGLPLASVDPARLVVGLDWRSADGQMTASGVVTAVDDLRGELDRAVPGAFAPPGFTTVDLYGEWRPNERWSVNLALLNALDRTSWSAGRIRGVLADDPQVGFYADPGRSFVATLAFRR